MTPPSDRSVPLRTCVGCRLRHPQLDLVRCVLAADGSARVDRTGPGRGAWVCSRECLATAIKRGGFARAWRTTVQPHQLERLDEQVDAALAARELFRIAATGESGARLTTTKG